MQHKRKNKGTCSRHTVVTLAQGIIEDIYVEDGCEGNLKAMAKLLKGQRASEMIALLKGTTCEHRKTSCPDQIALCLEEALALEQRETEHSKSA